MPENHPHTMQKHSSELSQKTVKTSFHQINHGTWQWKLFLFYDGLMMFFILINLFILLIQGIVLSDFGAWFSQNMWGSEHLIVARQYYIEHIAPLVRKGDFYFICYLIVELLLRWIISIVGKHHRHWWFFPFVHWYEVLAVFPTWRFLRLLRAGVIAYRLYELGYHVIPKKWIIKGQYYYAVVLEELTDRIVLTALHQVEKEFENSEKHHRLLHQIIDQHRAQFAEVLGETLHQTLAKEFTMRQQEISQNVGKIVHDAINNAPELHQMLRLVPMVGSRIEQQIHLIGQRLGENITAGLIQPFTQVPQSQQELTVLQDIANEISQVPLSSDKVDALVSSVMQESIHAIRDQIKVKHWKDLAKYDKQAIEQAFAKTQG